MHNTLIIMSASYLYHVLCCFWGVIFVLCSHRNSVFYVSDHKAWADKIYRRLQSCHTDYKKIGNRGKLGKSGQVQSKNLTALEKWKHEDTPSLPRSTSKVRRHSSSPKLMRCSTDSHHQQTVSWTKPLMTATTVARATQEKNSREPFSSSLTSPPAIRRTKKRTRDKDENTAPDQKAAHYRELMTVMKESPSHLVWSSGNRDRERDSFFTLLNDFTLRMPRTNWRQFQQRTVALPMEFTPAESPQTNSEAKNTAGAAAAAYHVPACKTSPSKQNYITRILLQYYLLLCLILVQHIMGTSRRKTRHLLL